MHKKLWLIDINSNIGITEKSLTEIFKDSNEYYKSFESFFSVETNRNLSILHSKQFNHRLNYNYSIGDDECGDIFVKYRPLNVTYRKFDDILYKLNTPENEFILVVRIKQNVDNDLNSLVQLISSTLEKYNPKYFIIYSVNNFDLNSNKIQKLTNKTNSKLTDSKSYLNLELNNKILNSFEIYKLNLNCGNFNTPLNKTFHFYVGLNKYRIEDKLNDEISKKLLNLTKIKKTSKFTKTLKNKESLENQFLTSLGKIWDKISHLKNIHLKILNKSYLKLLNVREMSLDELKLLKIYEKHKQFFDNWFIEEKIHQYPEKFRIIKNKSSNIIGSAKLIDDLKLTNQFVKFKNVVEINHKLGWLSNINSTPFVYFGVWGKINFVDMLNMKGFNDWNSVMSTSLTQYDKLTKNEFYELIPKNLLKSVIKTLIK